MTKQSLQLSALIHVGSLTTLLRTLYSSAPESGNFFLLIAGTYRRISFVPTKVSSYPSVSKCSTNFDELFFITKAVTNMMLNESRNII